MNYRRFFGDIIYKVTSDMLKERGQRMRLESEVKAAQPKVEYNEMAPEEFREKIQLLFENGQWVLKLPCDEVLAADVTLDFSRFLWE